MKIGKMLTNLCLAVALVMLCLCLLPNTAEAAETTASGTCGDNVTWALDANGILTISGTGAMDDYEGTGAMPWWAHRDLIKAVEVEAGVTTIGDYAFSFLAAKSEDADTELDADDSGIDVGGGVVSSRSNGIISVTIPASVTAVGDYAFYNCANLKYVCYTGSQSQWAAITVGTKNAHLQNKTVNYVADAGLCGDDLLWTLDETGKLTITGEGAMYNYVLGQSTSSAPWAELEINAVTIGDSVTTIGDSAFQYCDSLQSVTIPDSVITIGVSAFSNCGRLTDVYYGGTKADRNDITIGDDNDPLIDALWHCLQKDGWALEDGLWYYYRDGEKVTGWLKDGAVWYYMNTNGVMQTGWIKLGSVWYYLKPSGAMATGWAQVSGVWYYFNASGAMQTGWLQLGKTWYYLNSSGAMQTGWLKSGNVWYYLTPSGAMATGWAKVGNIWYYFASSGAMKTGWLKLGSTWYYFHSSGAMATGSVKVGAKTYNFASSGACLNP